MCTVYCLPVYECWPHICVADADVRGHKAHKRYAHSECVYMRNQQFFFIQKFHPRSIRYRRENQHLCSRSSIIHAHRSYTNTHTHSHILIAYSSITIYLQLKKRFDMLGREQNTDTNAHTQFYWMTFMRFTWHFDLSKKEICGKFCMNYFFFCFFFQSRTTSSFHQNELLHFTNDSQWNLHAQYETFTR